MTAAIIAEADAITASAARIRSLALAILAESPVATARYGITPDSMPGRNDAQKVAAAVAEAMERRRPLLLDRMYISESVVVTEDIEIVGSGGLVLPDNPSGIGAWGWQIYAHPAPGKTIRVSIDGITLNGNRDNAAARFNTSNNQPHTQHGIVLGGYYDTGLQGSVIAHVSNVTSCLHDMSGFVSFSERNDFLLMGYKAWGNGGSGLDVTRGKGTVIDSEAYENGGLGFNASNGELVRIIRSQVRNGGRGRGRPSVGKPMVGGGIKISNRPFGDSPAAHLYLDDVTISGCVGTGLTATSSPAGSTITGGRVVIDGCTHHAVNLTDGQASIRLRELTCTNGLRPIPADVAGPYTPDVIDADVLIHGGNRAEFGSLAVNSSSKRGIAGGWGSSLTAGRIDARGNTQTGLTWVDGPFDCSEVLR